jgi:hypothetical protein
VTGRTPTIDLAPLRAERFAADGTRRVERIVI